MILKDAVVEDILIVLKGTAIVAFEISVSAAPSLPVVVVTFIFKVDGTISETPLRLIVKVWAIFPDVPVSFLVAVALAKDGSG